MLTRKTSDPRQIVRRGIAMFDPLHRCGAVCLFVFTAVILTGCTGGVRRQDDSAWQSLFNGKNLDGWQVKCKPEDRSKGFWKVQDGSIVADSLGHSGHDYVWLATEDEFDNFVLRFRFQAYRDSPGNSGVQIRSRYDDSTYWLNGPQVDIHPPLPWRTGMVWDETRGNQRWLYPKVAPGEWVDESMAPPGHTFHYSDQRPAWNQMEIRAEGTHIQAKLNGVSVLDYDGQGVLGDDIHRAKNVGLRGHIALQIHSGDAVHIRYKDIQIRNLPPSLLALREMDMHLHAGVEREVDLDRWIDLAIADGRKVLVLLDHLELYRITQAEYEAWAKERGSEMWYPVRPNRYETLMADFDRIAKQRRIQIFKGWEIYEGELDTGLEKEPMKLADVLGWHISPNNGREAPNGEKLIERAKQVRAAQKEFPVPMILFHPFTMRIENIQRTAEREGRDRASLTVEEYRFFKPGEQRELADVLRGESIYVEISRATGRYWEDPVIREALIADIRPLAEAGVQFTVSTDAHGLGSAERSFQPERYCKDLGVTPQNTNAIIEDLRAKR